jgi:serine/threonine protein kinase
MPGRRPLYTLVPAIVDDGLIHASVIAQKNLQRNMFLVGKCACAALFPQDLLTRMLVYEPSMRSSAAQLRSHSFIVSSPVIEQQPSVHYTATQQNNMVYYAPQTIEQSHYTSHVSYAAPTNSADTSGF